MEEFLYNEFKIKAREIVRLTCGVGGESYLIICDNEKYVLKICDSNEMNNVEAEPELCNYLLQNNIPVCHFIKNKEGKLITKYSNRYCQLKYYIEGKVLECNTAPEFYMKESPIILGKIHKTLESYKDLPMGLGKDFFQVYDS